jgi:hypothetical protein
VIDLCIGGIDVQRIIGQEAELGSAEEQMSVINTQFTKPQFSKSLPGMLRVLILTLLPHHPCENDSGIERLMDLNSRYTQCQSSSYCKILK